MTAKKNPAAPTEIENLWGLFCEANNYDQVPQLMGLWLGKPSLAQVAEAVGHTFPASSDARTLGVVNVWAGKADARIDDDCWTLKRVSVAKGAGV